MHPLRDLLQGAYDDPAVNQYHPATKQGDQAMITRSGKARSSRARSSLFSNQTSARSAVSLAVAVALTAPSALYAQDTTRDDKLEEILVTGFKASLENSAEIKKTSSSIVEVVTAEEIGKLPDASIAESIARLPGLTAQRLNGRGQVISVRGLGPDFTSSLLNGREQVSVGDNRGVEFDQYPSELLSGVVVYKTPDATLTSQGLGGTVNLRTVRPLDYGKRALAANLRYEMNEIDALNAGAENTGLRYSGSYIDQFNDGTVGVAIGLAHMSNPSQEERFNAWGYADGPANNKVIGGSKPFARSGELTRDGIIGVLEFKPSDTFSAAVDVYYSEFEETQYLRGIELPLQWSAASLQSGFQSSGGLITQGQFNGVKGIVRNDINLRDAKLFAAGLNMKFNVGESWTGEVDASTSRTKRKDFIIETYSGTGPGGTGATDNMGFTLGETGAVFTSTVNYASSSVIKLTDPGGWGQTGYYNNPAVEDELTQFRVSADRDLEGRIAGVTVGVNYTDRSKDLLVDEYFLGLAGTATTANIANPIGVTDLSFLGITSGMISYDPLAVIDNGTMVKRRNSNWDVRIKSWEVEEKVTTGYLKFDLDAELAAKPLTGNFGVQVVQTDQSSTGDAALNDYGVVRGTRVSGGKKYTEVLPSLNLTLRTNEDQFVRFAIARTLARPRMDEMNASRNFSFNAANATQTDINRSPWSGGGGNPELKPWLARAFDLSFENYFEGRKGYVAVAGFYKDLENYIFVQPELFDFTGFPTGGVTPRLTQGLYFAPRNGEGGNIYGAELTAQVTGEMIASGLSGFGVLLNASKTKTSIEDPDSPGRALPGYSEDVVNVTLFYEAAGFSARVSNRYRSDFLGEVAGFGNGRNFRLVEGESVVDAQIGYRFSGSLEGISLMLQGFNLSDERFGTFNEVDSRQIIDSQRYGRSYMLGVSWSAK